jgi:hypothetical protein
MSGVPWKKSIQNLKIFVKICFASLFHGTPLAAFLGTAHSYWFVSPTPSAVFPCPSALGVGCTLVLLDLGS